ncbi:class I adenylate-forming enzyme family protein [Georgenia sp. H159]|uniref:class I adenylate-forming enzyme family protein n=1 Tax=Georgenia sp. H159 TaxID=3076115 RepID=UPI002D77F9DB|nr:AMP-binding protein [Georgenia sp. H159]
MKVIDNFDTGLALGPNRPVLVDPGTGEVRTYNEVARFTHRFAHAVRSRGLGKDSKIAVLSRNDVLMYEVILGTMRSDAIWTPISARASYPETVDLLTRFDCDVLFYEEGTEALLGLIAASSRRGMDTVPLNREAVERWVGDQPDTDFRSDATGETIYAIQATGGTTGVPKGVLFSNDNAEYIVRSFETMCPFTATERTPHPVFLASAPLTHAAGQVMQLALRQGGTGVVVGAARPAELLELIERFSVTHLFLPPTVIYGMLEQPTLTAHDYSSLQYLLYGAAPMSPNKLAQAVDAFGPVLAQLYGQTETGVPNVFMRPEEHFVDGDPANGIAPASRLTAAGRPVPGTSLVILDEDGNPRPVGATGEIAIDCKGVTPGYYDDPEATAAVKAGRYHRTGDIAFIDEDGFVHIVDRKRDIIITGGFNVYSAEVERRILSFPGVQECSVFGVPDEKWGEAVTAALELSPGATVDIEELRAYCRAELGPVKTPKHFEIRDRLPRSAVGKVLKRELRAEHWKGNKRMVS